MKKILLFLTLIPTLSTGQVSDWRKKSNTSSSQNTIPPPSNDTRRTTDETPKISSWRKDPPKSETPNYYNPPRRPLSTFYSPNYFGPNRWYGWGAPTFFDYWTPSFYYNSWGYREPEGFIIEREDEILSEVEKYISLSDFKQPHLKIKLAVGLQSGIEFTLLVSSTCQST